MCSLSALQSSGLYIKCVDELLHPAYALHAPFGLYGGVFLSIVMLSYTQEFF